MTERILLLNLTRMGDLIQSTPLIAGLRKKYPRARIDMMVAGDFAEFSKRIPGVDNIFVFNLRQFNRDERKWNWVEVYRYLESRLNEIVGQDYQLLFNLSHSKLSALMVSYLGIPDVRGFGCHETGDRKTDHPWMQYFGVEPFNRGLNTFNLVDIFARSGDVVPEGRVEVLCRAEDTIQIEKKWKEARSGNDGPLIGIQAGSSLQGRRWPAKSFARLADLLVKKLDARIVLFGVNSESALAEEITGEMAFKDRALNLCGKTDIPELIAWVKKCDYLVTNDTGTMHIAAAVGTTIVGLFFAHANPWETGPYGSGHLVCQARIDCAPCSYGVQCNNTVCVEKAAPEHFAALMERRHHSGAWQMVPEISGLDEVDFFVTGFDEDGLYSLNSLIPRPITVQDIFRRAYRKMWLDSLGNGDPERKPFPVPISIPIPNVSLAECETEFIAGTQGQLNEKLAAFRELATLGERGLEVSKALTDILAKPSLNAMAIKNLGREMEGVDERINFLGMTQAEAKPVADMFSKRKENLSGEDLTQMARATGTYYRKLNEECLGMIENVSRYTVEIFETRPDLMSTGFSRSCKVAAPGR